MKRRRQRRHDEGRQQLRRILYERQPFPDNYVDDTFLNDIRKNVDIRIYRTREAIVATGVLTQEICSVIIFAVTFGFLHRGNLSPDTLLYLALVCAPVIHFGNVYCAGRATAPVGRDVAGNVVAKRTGVVRQIVADVKLAALYLIVNFAFSPVLKTLTETISSDTVYAMATASMLVHLVTHDYGPSFPIVSSAMSFNAALFGVVCLASRLPDSLSTFALVTASAEIFALLPHFRGQLYRWGGSVGRIGSTVAAVGVTVTILFLVSRPLAASVLAIIAFVNVACPVLFVRWQTYKENLYGPWDEAILKT